MKVSTLCVILFHHYVVWLRTVLVPLVILSTGVVVSQEGGGILAQAQTAELPYNPVSHYNTTLPSVNVHLSSLQAFAGMATSVSHSLYSPLFKKLDQMTLMCCCMQYSLQAICTPQFLLHRRLMTAFWALAYIL